MKCPFCSCEESKVIDSRPTDEGERIRRRRECIGCGKRFTTYEIIETKTHTFLVYEYFNGMKLSDYIIKKKQRIICRFLFILY